MRKCCLQKDIPRIANISLCLRCFSLLPEICAVSDSLPSSNISTSHLKFFILAHGASAAVQGSISHGKFFLPFNSLREENPSYIASLDLSVKKAFHNSNFSFMVSFANRHCNIRLTRTCWPAENNVFDSIVEQLSN